MGIMQNYFCRGGWVYVSNESSAVEAELYNIKKDLSKKLNLETDETRLDFFSQKDLYFSF